jgi:hypothetical protein
MPSEDGAAKEVAAAHAFQMEVESNALVSFREPGSRDELTVQYRFKLQKTSYSSHVN